MAQYGERSRLCHICCGLSLFLYIWEMNRNGYVSSEGCLEGCFGIVLCLDLPAKSANDGRLSEQEKEVFYYNYLAE